MSHLSREHHSNVITGNTGPVIWLLVTANKNKGWRRHGCFTVSPLPEKPVRDDDDDEYLLFLKTIILTTGRGR